MHQPRTASAGPTRLAVLALCLAASLQAQQAGRPANVSVAPERHSDILPQPAPDGVNLSRTAGLHLLDGTLWGVGDGYSVRFDTAGFEFTPALGSTAPREYPMRFELESIGRGDAMVGAGGADPRAPAWRNLRVEYDRGIVIERYDIGVDAMEQSFVFHELPAGTGDLIVRGRLATDMLVTPRGEGLRLEQPGLGGFDIGGVVGIDGEGKRAVGRVRCAAGILELSLPAAFVDSAALPLTLDPLIGGVFRITTSRGDFFARVAFDASTDSYLVVWETSSAIHAHRVGRDGTLLGIRFLIDASGRSPEVANVNDRNAFVVVFEQNGDIVGRTVAAGNGSVALGTIIAGGAATQSQPAVGGSRAIGLVARGRAMCAWTSGNGTLEAAALVVNVDLTISVGMVQTVATAGLLPPRLPQLSRSDGSVGRYALAFLRVDSLSSIHRVVARVLNSSGQAITSELVVDPTLEEQSSCQVDGDGTNWVVAWPAFGAGVIAKARAIHFSPSQSTLTPGLPVIDVGATTANDASVTWTGDSSVVGRSNGSERILSSVDPFTCTRCDGTWPIPGLGVGPSTPFGCGTIAGGGAADEALFVGSDSSGIYAQRFRSADGVVTSRGGGCGRGGTAHATCARAPNPLFTHRLRSSISNAPAIFVISSGESALPCGSCTLIPALGAAITVSTTTTATGDASIPLGLPVNSPLVGIPLFSQWVTLSVSSPACAQFSFDLSNALRVVIEPGS